MPSDMRRIVEMSSTVGKAEKSSGFWIHRETMRMRTEKAIDSARPKSIRKGGMGTKRIARMARMPVAKPTSRIEWRSAGALSRVVVLSEALMAPICQPGLARRWAGVAPLVASRGGFESGCDITPSLVSPPQGVMHFASQARR